MGLSSLEATVTAAKTRGSTYVTITAHVQRDAGEAIKRLAAQRGVSVSACAAVLLAEALRANVEHQHGALLEAAVECTIRSSLSRHLHRLGELSFRAALDSDEARRLVLTLLVSAIGAEQTKQFRREAHSAS
jgi:hypothetical protein